MPVIAAPSCVIPGTIAQNLRFLAGAAKGRIQEIALCFFETDACLAYTEEDLPAELAAFRLHVHLPVDLPWPAGADCAAGCALSLMHKVAAFAPRAAVLHAPDSPDAAGLLKTFAALWHTRCNVPLLLENTSSCGLVELGAVIAEAGLGLCLDLAHLSAYGQESLLEASELVARTKIAHWSAPGGADRHLPLSALTPEEISFMRSAAEKLPPGITHLLEVFDWAGVEESLTVLPELIYFA